MLTEVTDTVLKKSNSKQKFAHFHLVTFQS